MNGLTILLLSIIPHDGAVLRESVSVIEHNRYYNDCGEQVFAQIIFHEWIRDHHDITAWRLVKDASMVPVKVRGRFVVLWYDDGGQLQPDGPGGGREAVATFGATERTSTMSLGPSFPQPDDDVVGLTPCDVERIFVEPSMYSRKDRKAWEARVTAGVRRALVEYENGRDVKHEDVTKAAEVVMAFMDGMGS